MNHGEHHPMLINQLC